MIRRVQEQKISYPEFPRRRDIESADQVESRNIAPQSFYFRVKNGLENIHAGIKYLGKITFTSENKYNISFATFFTISNIGLNFFAPFVLSKAIGAVANKDTYSAPLGDTELPHWALISLYGASLLASQYFSNFRDRALITVNARAIQNSIMDAVRNQLEKKSLQYHNTASFGEQIYLVQKSFGMTNSIDQILKQIIPTMVEICLAMIILSEEYDFTLGILLASMFISFIVYSVKKSTNIINSREKLLKINNELFIVLTSALKQYKTTHDFSRTKHVLEDLKKNLQLYKNINISSQLKVIKTSFGQITISQVFLSSILLRVSFQVSSGKLNASDFIFIANYLLTLSTSFPALGNAITTLLTAWPDWMFVIKALSKPTEVPNPNPDAQLQINKNHPVISFNDVNFKYDNKNNEIVFKKLNFEITTGKKVLLIGESGCGKSSIFYLLFRYYLPNSGNICIYGQDILKDVGLESLRLNISVVSQKANLFNDTVRNNILSGSPCPADITEADIMNIAKSAGLEEFIINLGLDTQVGEDGNKLSGGQQQKIAILRSLFKDASILLLDEITSALDSVSAREVLNCITKIQQTRGLTILAISHNPTEFQHADEIIVFKKNEGIVSKGNHHDLLEKCSEYRKLYHNIESTAPEPHSTPVVHTDLIIRNVSSVTGELVPPEMLTEDEEKD